MAIPKICGIETEYGIVHRGVPDPNPITASSVLINAYLGALATDAGRELPKIGWDFEDESPGNDARGVPPAESLAPEVETHLVNAVLTNGARFYVDHAHPELSTPECADARSVVVWDRAAEVILGEAMTAAGRLLPEGQEIVVYKNNSDRKGNSYGCHENYLMDRAVPFGRIVTHVTPHFVSRQIFCGAGKVGLELGGRTDREVPYQLTQRAEFFEEEVGLETTLKRPIVNTRDEPHADPQKYRRLHVIVGDANMSEVATFLKVGTTLFVLAMIEDDLLPPALELAAPVHALRAVSFDPSLRTAVELADGSTATALDIQWELFDRARKYAEDRGTDHVGGTVAHEVLARWEQTLTGLEHDPMTLHRQLDWVAKLRVIEGYRAKHDLAWDDARLAAMDLQYHDLRVPRSLYGRLDMERLTTDTEVGAAVHAPPTDTRAYFRGRCLARWPDEIVAANWDSLVFDTGGAPLRRVPMMEPAKGTRRHVGQLIDESATAADLLAALGS